MDYIITAAWCGSLWMVCKTAPICLASWAERAKYKYKTERIKDQLHRDACNTIHHLRAENDALTAMVMAYHTTKEK